MIFVNLCIFVEGTVGNGAGRVDVHLYQSESLNQKEVEVREPHLVKARLSQTHKKELDDEV